MKVRLALLLAAAAGCRSASPTSPIVEEPVERPLPPASGTPIGILLDEAGKLQLRPEQIDKLREIDQTLTARNDRLDSELRGLEHSTAGPGASGQGPPQRRGGRRGGGGMGGPPGGGGGGGMGGPPMGRGHHGRGGKPPGGGPPPAGAQGGPASRSKLMDERSANVHEAIAHALEALDPSQRSIAQQILDDHVTTAAPPAGEK